MAEYNPSKIIKDGNTYNFRDTTKIPLAGSNEISGSLVPSTDGTVNLGSSTAQWNNAYIKSLTINGTQFLPSDYATLSGLSTVATSGSYNDLSNKPTIPTVNNGTLTIQQNSTTVDSFSANSSTDKTVNIQCVDLTNNQTVAGNKEFTGTTTAHDLVPSDTDTYNLGSPSVQWNNAYIKSLTINGVACGDILTHNASEFAYDTNVVHKSGNETVNGLKTFLKYITSDGSSMGDEYSPNARTNLWLMGNRDTEEVSGVLFDTYRQNTAQGTGSHILGIGIKENSARYEGCRWGWYWNNDLNGYSFDFKPTTQGANQALKHNLGTSTDKWSTINGLNPSSLSLPSGNASDVIDISSYITALNGTSNSYTVPANGWISIAVVGTAIAIVSSSWSDSRSRESSGNVRMLYPVLKNETLDISVIGTTLTYARFIPCQGNV